VALVTTRAPDGREPSTDRTPLVVFEGLDGVGKSTVARATALRLGAVLLQTPERSRADERREVDRRYARRPNARTRWYAQSVARVSRDIETWLARGQAVVVDRYFLSTMVYGRQRKATVDLEPYARGLVVPCLTVMLHARPEVRAARLASREHRSSEDQRTTHPEIAAALEHGYRSAGTHRVAGRVLWLDASDASPDALAAQVLRHLWPSPS
jgi:dTMP kinase/UMP-CMP kinase 2